MRRWSAGLAVALLTAAAPASADRPPSGSTWTEDHLTSRDGTRLHADVFRPSGLTEDDRTPAMLVVSPYLGSPTPDDPGPPKVLDWYRPLYEGAIGRGYSIVQVSFRGTGGSGGCGDFGGPGEQGDVAAAIEWAATRPWSTGRVGQVGHSYDGYAAIVGLAQRPPELAASVLMAPAVDLYRGIYMNGVAYVQTRGVATYYQGFSLLSPAFGRDPTCAPGVIAEAQNPDHAAPFWRERDLTERAAGSRVPVFWTHGFLDGRDDFSATRPDNFAGLWTRLAGPRRAWFGQFPHVVPGERNTWGEPEPVGRDSFTREALDWLDAYVKEDGRALRAVQSEPPVAIQEGAAGAWRSERDWPGAARTASLPLAPGTYSDRAGNKAEQGDDPGGSCDDGARARCNPLSRTGEGTWTFSDPLPRDAHLAGSARLRATLAPAAAGARVIAIVYDVDEQNQATLLTRGAALVPEDGRVDFELYPQDWRLGRGHRIGVLLSGSDDFYFEPGQTNAEVRVDAGSLALPLVTARGPALAGEPSRAVRERTSFPVEPATIDDRSRALALPAEKLRLEVNPRRVRRGRRVTLRIATTDSAGKAVPRARVRVGRRLWRTGSRGTVRVRTRFMRPGRRAVRASSAGFTRARAYVRVRRR